MEAESAKGLVDGIALLTATRDVCQSGSDAATVERLVRELMPSALPLNEETGDVATRLLAAATGTAVAAIRMMQTMIDVLVDVEGLDRGLLDRALVASLQATAMWANEQAG